MQKLCRPSIHNYYQRLINFIFKMYAYMTEYLSIVNK